MSYQTFHPDTGTTVVRIGRYNEDSSESADNESSRLYPFGKPVFLTGLPVQMGIVKLNCLKVSIASK
jgi:hypothetical protein